ncbi:hypothetical protein [Chenggangzhangella methanolivorans]|uniref:Uncharacterized protein n=1 Tax=Chenggangzhangella methanolivorans TaxID=1437009 RepID=A0A9E6R5J9_9HYPH|nr:hypothetical protein [Chenggangzhangella methanolivorans]QZN98273.1 hypothetical protein K6K41_14060 [Chenggangzhangella methanolivorans]
MGTVAALLALKLLTLAGSTATTAWLVSFLFFTETLAAYRWELFLGGFAAIAIGELGAALLGRKAAKDATTES